MEISYQYNRPRKMFGRQCCFATDGPKLLEDLRTDKVLLDKYLVKTPVSKGVQVGYVMSENTTNTHVKDYNDRGMNHFEGGWPKEVDMNDEEAVLRFRKKVERLDNYIAAMQRLTKPMEHAILQNNAINIYERYFEECVSAVPEDKETCRIQSKFRDPLKPRRPITGCSWSPDGTQFCLAYGSRHFQSNLDIISFNSFIWDLQRPLTPEMALIGESPILTLEYNNRDPHWLIGGLYSGQVTHFDTRRGSNSVGISPVVESHRDPTHTVLWINSKSGTEFFSTSTDGVVKWWDCRRLDHAIEYIILDPVRGDQNITRAFPASCLEYEPSVPARYMVGTETGYVITGNRKGVSITEKLPVIQKCQAGPVYAIHRNQGFAKNYLVIGAWSAKIWSEDCRESPIIWTKNYRQKLTKGEWSAGRLSVFFLTRDDGVLDVWDIIIDQENPCLSLRLCEEPLTAMRVMQDGLLLLAGNSDGAAFVVRFPSTFAESLKNEKMFLSSMFDRESRREKLLESKNRELKLKQRELMLAKETAGESGQKTEVEIHTEHYKKTLETDYLTEIANNLKLLEEKKGKPPEA